MSAITEKQAEYIKILSSYDYSKKEDEEDIANFLKKYNKQKISQLTKGEASDLIKILLQRPTEYIFLCGKKAILDKQEINSFHFMGEIEACGHHCPDKKIQGDVNNCPHFKDQEDFEIC